MVTWRTPSERSKHYVLHAYIVTHALVTGGKTINTNILNERGTLDTVNAAIEVNESVELTDRE